MNDLERFVDAVRECGHPHAAEVVDRLTKPRAATEAFGEGEEYAVISTPNATVVEGDKEARIPILISSDNPEQTVEGVALSVRCDNPKDTSKFGQVLVTHPNDAFGESLWHFHPSLIAAVYPSSVGSTYFVAVPFLPPHGVIHADGMVCVVTVDTSKMKAGEEYTVNTNAEGRSSAVRNIGVNDNAPVVLTHKGGKISVVAKK